MPSPLSLGRSGPERRPKLPKNNSFRTTLNLFRGPGSSHGFSVSLEAWFSQPVARASESTSDSALMMVIVIVTRAPLLLHLTAADSVLSV